MVVCVGLILNGANLYGYVRCRVGTREKLSSMATNFIGTQMLKNVSIELEMQLVLYTELQIEQVTYYRDIVLS